MTRKYARIPLSLNLSNLFLNCWNLETTIAFSHVPCQLPLDGQPPACLVAATPFQRRSGTSGTFPSFQWKSTCQSSGFLIYYHELLLSCSLVLTIIYSISICTQTSSQPPRHAKKKWRTIGITFFGLKLGFNPEEHKTMRVNLSLPMPVAPSLGTSWEETNLPS